MKRLVIAAALCLALVLPVSLTGAFLALAEEEVLPSQLALDEIPAELLPIYMAAALTCEGLPWTALAAIHKVETNFGTGRAISPKGAQGPMQFMTATWRAYGVDGDGDGVANVNDPEDSIFSAANLLCRNGGGDPARLSSAVWNYNHSDTYVREVLSLAASYGVVFFGESLVAASPSDILGNPRITFTPSARADVHAGIVDARLLALLDAIARRYPIGISVFKSGHSKYVAGTDRVSKHFYGRAVDVSFVGGEPVSTTNVSARDLVIMMSQGVEELGVVEVGHPFGAVQFPGGFTDAHHLDHLHLAVE